MLAPAVQRRFHQIVVPHQEIRVGSLFREKSFYVILAIVLLSLLIASVAELGRALHEMPPI
jgi:hypothetical protein